MKKKGTTKSKGNKHTLDKFYTKDNVAIYCINSIDNIKEYDLIIEPSAGGGAFSRNIDNVLAFDIAPEHPDIIYADYLKEDMSQHIVNKHNILVVGNPPFGTNGNIALKFLNKSMEYADTVAFILPKSFMKTSMKNKVNNNFHLAKEIILGDNSFTLISEDYSVPTVFQIWEKSEQKRETSKCKTETKLFTFEKTKDLADFRIQRVGGNAGKASYNMDVSASSNYFIKVNREILTVESLYNIVNSLEIKEAEYTTGPKSISKRELIRYIENVFNKICIHNIKQE